MIYIAIWNALVFLLYGVDKLMAKLKKRRIPEIWLIASAIMSGGFGAAAGMVVFHHKINKWEFYVIIGIALAITFGTILLTGK